MDTTDSTSQTSRPITLLELGFRPFFLFAALYSVVATLVWFAVYVLNLQPALPGAAVTWHAHEMVYGYGAAVVAGFLLTATQNWTGIRTLHSSALAILLALWLVPRIVMLAWPSVPVSLPALFDIAFMAYLIGAVATVIAKSGNKKQFFVVSLLALLLLSNVAYYLGQAGILPGATRTANISGLYALLGLILILARRVIPSFTESGVGYAVQLRNHAWVDKSSLAAFALFWISELADFGNALRALVACALFLLHAFRLSGWYTHGIWRKPLLWVLHVAYAFITAGFLLTALSAFADLPGQLAIHAFAYGGVGMMTLGMMSRVSLGHTGRNVHQPPNALAVAFGTVLAGGLVRVLAPIVDPSRYALWIGMSQALWVVAFTIFLAVLGVALLRPRIDGKPG